MQLKLNNDLNGCMHWPLTFRLVDLLQLPTTQMIRPACPRTVEQKVDLTFDFLLNLGFDPLLHNSHWKKKRDVRSHFKSHHSMSSSKEADLMRRPWRRRRNKLKKNDLSFQDGGEQQR